MTQEVGASSLELTKECAAEGTSAAPPLAYELLRLASARAALDPDRRAWRHDILLSAIIETISLYGPQPIDRLHGHICRAWATDSIPRTAVEAALEAAAEAQLLRRTVDLNSREEKWELSEATRKESKQDSEWVSAIFAEFGAELRRRVKAITETPVRRDRESALAVSMFAALAHGANGTYEFARGAMTVDQLRPASIDVDAASRYLSDHVKPAPVAAAVAEVLLAIVNPDDPLGNEVLRLLIVGNILQGMLSGRDLAASISPSGFRVVLDTSTLMHLLSDDTPEYRLLVDFLDRCQCVGAEVYVTEHTLAEWERVWQAAESAVAARDTAKIRGLTEGYALAGNPVVREYIRHLRADDTGNWTRFCIGRRDPRQFLESRGVVVREHGNRSDDDLELMTRVSDRLHELSEDSKVRGDRTAQAAEDDANTCAMVSRWRDRQPADPPTAWFVAYDRLTDVAYREATGSEYPLCIPLSAALLLMSNLCGDDAADVMRLVETVSSAATRDSFLAVAASYGLDEILELAKKMSPTAELSAEDAAIAVRLNFEAMMADAKRFGTEEDRRRLATEAVQLRGSRRIARGDRAVASAQRQAGEMAQRERDAHDAGFVAGRKQMDELVQAERRKTTRIARGSLLGATVVVVLTALTMLALTGLSSWTVVAVAGLFMVVAAGSALRYVRNPKMSSIEFVAQPRRRIRHCFARVC